MNNKKYDLSIIGGGAAGLVASVASATFGAKTLLIEKDRLGGECSWTGCIPSKTLISVANLIYKAKTGFLGKNGIGFEREEKKLDDVFSYVRQVIEEAPKRSKAGDLLKRTGVDIVFGPASFMDKNHICVDGKTYFSKRSIIATGSSALAPPIKGLQPGYLTNVGIWDLKKIPSSLAIIGAGPIGCEMAQAFNRLGCNVFLFDISERILPKDDGELSVMLGDLFKEEKIGLYLKHSIHEVEKTANGWKIYAQEKGNGALDIVHASQLLVATGRQANTEGLNLEAAGAAYDKKSIFTDKHLRTTAANIWAAGDCNGIYQFSHMAEAEAKTAVRNALFPLPSKVDYQGVPWTTFTEPEMAHLGFTEEECKSKGIRYKVYRQSFAGDDRAITEDSAYGLVKIISSMDAKIIGCHILGPRAGELINEVVLAKRKNIRVYDLGLTIHVYPTLGMAIQRATDEWFADLVGKKPINRLIRIIRKR